MPVQRANSELSALLSVDLAGNGFEYMHEPIGDIGIWNGQFETGSDAAPEGWQLTPSTDGTLVRTTGGLAGNYCMMGSCGATAGRGGYIQGLRYIPVDETRCYYVSFAAKASNASGTIYALVTCYNAAKTAIGLSIIVPAATAPGVAWVRYERTIGAGTLVPLTAGTRYVRLLIALQWDITLTNTAVYCDDVQFGQLKASSSSTLILDTGYALNIVAATNNAAVYQVHSTFNLTLTEPGYIWGFADASLSHNTTGALKFSAAMMINAATFIGFSWYGSVATYFIGSTFAGRSTAMLPAGVYAVSYGFSPLVAGEITTCWRSQISGFWTRAA
jgi:hypothetical protein